MNTEKIQKLMLDIGDDLPRQMTSAELLSFLIAISIYYTHSADMVVALLKEGINIVESDKDFVNMSFRQAVANVADEP